MEQKKCLHVYSKTCSLENIDQKKGAESKRKKIINEFCPNGRDDRVSTKTPSPLSNQTKVEFEMTNKKYTRGACSVQQEKCDKKQLNFNSSKFQSKFSSYKKIEDYFFDKAKQYQLTAQEMAISLSLIEFLVYDSNIAICSLNELSEAARVSKKTLIEALKRLESCELIDKHQASGYKNSYRLSYAYVGIKEKQLNIKEATYSANKSKKIKTPYHKTGGSYLHQGVGEIETTSIYKRINKETKKNKDFVFTKKIEDDFSENVQNEKKINLCKTYMDLLKRTGKLTIRTCESTYLSSMYKNNEAFSTWENIEEKIQILEQQIARQEIEKKEALRAVVVVDDQQKKKSEAETECIEKLSKLELNIFEKQAKELLKIKFKTINFESSFGIQILRSKIVELAQKWASQRSKNSYTVCKRDATSQPISSNNSKGNRVAAYYSTRLSEKKA